MKFRFLFILLVAPMLAMAQSIKLEGTVISVADSEPLAGVTVNIVGTSVAAITDVNGHYVLNADKPGQVQFTFIGCKTVTKNYSASQTMDVSLEDDYNLLDEVVAVGYGTMKKSDLTGSVTVVKSDNLKKTPAASMDQALQGRAAGVTVNASSGQPGAAAEIRIRGIGTVNDSSPIYVVDGIICSDITFLSPSDIESTEILKDASATAIYGSRGANGVILVTTKKGDKGHSQVNFNMYYGIQNRWKKLDIMNKEDFVATYLDINAPKSERNYYNKNGFNEWLYRYKTGNDNHFAVPMTSKHAEGLDYSLIDTDWQDEIFNSNAVIQNYHVSLDGGTDKANYSFSTSYFDQDGIIIGSDYKRFTLRANTSFQVKKWLKIGENLSYVYGTGRSALNNSLESGILSQALSMAPWDPAYYPQGAVSVKGKDLSGAIAPGSNNKNVYNPMSMVYNSNPKNVNSRWIGDVYIEINPVKGLTYRTDVSYDEVTSRFRLFKPKYEVSSYDRLERNYLTRSMTHFTTFTWENTLTYDFKLNDHSLNIMGGQTTEEYNYYTIGGSGSDIQNPVEKNWYLNNTTYDRTNAGDGVTRTRRMSFLGRLHYIYKDRYLATVNFRADGSNKFPENTWGYFPSVALAWKANEEAFLKDVNWLDYLKLRAGWGLIGNDKIGNDAFNQTVFTAGPTFVNYPLGPAGELVPGATILTYINKGGKWERTETWNAGIDFAASGGIISANADFYVRNTRDMLLWVKGPAWAGNRYDAQNNVGTVRNVGFELTLGHRNNIGKFNYNVDANISVVSNKLTALNGGEKVWGHVTVCDEGLPLYTFWGYKYKGVYNSQEEADAHLWGYAKAGETNPYSAGDAIFEDINNDGRINDEDKTRIGNPFPKFTYGLNIDMDWHGFDMSLFFQGVAGSKIYNFLRTRLEGTGTGSQLSKDMLNVWTPGKANPEDPTAAKVFGTIPFPNGNSNNSAISDRFVENGSYLRLKNIQLGYTLPKKVLAKMNITKLRLYASMSNVFTITNYSGYDPEVAGGVDYGNYPQSRTFLVGVNLAF